MYRFFKNYIDRFFIIAVYVHYVQGITTWTQLIADVTTFMARNPLTIPNRVRDWLHQSFDNLSNYPDPSLPEVTDDLVKYMGGQKPTSDRDLIDIIVETLRMPLQGNRLSVGQLHELQRAIMSPNEIGGLRDILAQKELFCATCSRKLREREMVTFEVSSTGYPQIQCYRCYHPQLVGCSGCDKVIELDKKFYVGSTTDCKEHSGITQVKLKPTKRASVTIGQRARAAGPIPAPPPTLGDFDTFTNTLGSMDDPNDNL